MNIDALIAVAIAGLLIWWGASRIRGTRPVGDPFYSSPYFVLWVLVAIVLTLLLV